MSSLIRRARLGKASGEAVKFTASIAADAELSEAILDINRAHVVMLIDRHIVDRQVGTKLLRALVRLRKIPTKKNVEDLHLALESAIVDRVGIDVGGYINIAKSRNDQVATAIRMRLRREILEIIDMGLNLLAKLQRIIRTHKGAILIGRTHLQPAEPITFGHYLLAFHDVVLRDLERLEEAYVRVNRSPMGAVALAGTSHPIDRRLVAELLGFKGLIENSLDSVGSRDFALEFLSTITCLAIDISRLAEDLIFYTTPEVDQVELPNELAFTSSVMPQKKNPDVLEVMRARCTVPLRDFISSASILHSLPSSYNLDLQEVTPSLWSTATTIKHILRMLTITLEKLRVKSPSRTERHLAFTTELANLLVRRFKLPFRTAHQIVAYAVKADSEREKTERLDWVKLITDASQRIINRPLTLTRKDLDQVFNARSIVNARRSMGSPAAKETINQLRRRSIELKEFFRRQERRKRALNDSRLRLKRSVSAVIR